MTDVGAFRAEQRRVARAMALGVVTTVVVLVIAAAVPVAPPAVPVAERLRDALRFDVLVVAWLAAAIGNVARLRFGSPGDIGGSVAGPGSASVRASTAILQNTLEQVALAVPAHLALAASMDHPAPLLGALAGLFCVGRALFWAGYRGGAAARALGFALTFYPSVASLGICVVMLLRDLLA